MITKNKKKIFSFFLVLFVGGGVFFLVPSAHATISDWAGEIIGGLIGWIISAFGLILVLVMKALVLVAQYSNFIGSPAVENGWKMVRDICNMFFVLVLLIIAFATILKIENYSYKKWLPKLIMMAILINFSKTICGLLIDFAQVVMLTFVNAFKDIAAGNLITNLGITDILTLAQTSDKIGFWEIVGSYVLGLIYILVALVVIVTMLAMLVMRIVMIWIYVVLSPAAYLLSAFPGGQKYASQWWSEFTKNLIVGPVLAFFIWLSFMSLQAQNSTQFNADFKVTDDTTGSIATEAGMSTTYANGAGTTGSKASTSGVFIKFIIAIGMLIGGLKISQEIGGAAGGIAGKGMAKLQQGATFVGKKSKEGAKALGGTAVMMTAGSKTGKKFLGDVAASKNPLLKYTGMRSLATGGLIKVNKKQKEIETKAEEKINNLKNTKVVARFAQEKAILPGGMAAKKKAVNMMPSALGNPADVAKQLAGMSREDLGKLSDPEWYAIGQTGAEVRGRAQKYVQKNSDERGAYNLGRQDGGHGHLVKGTDKNGADIIGPDADGSYMEPGNAVHHDPSERDRVKRQNDSSTFYLKDSPKPEAEKTTKVEPEKADAPRGNGNMSVNDFASERSDTVAVDFDKLNVKGIDKGGDADNRNVRGLNTSDPALIKEVSAKMVGMIDQELNRIRSKGENTTAGDYKRMGNLEGAKARFSKPEAIDNLSMVNSSAASYKLSDVKTSKIHEEVHGLGVEDEDDTKYVTQQVLDGKKYNTKTGRTDKNTVGQILADKPNNQISAGKPRQGATQKAPVSDILKREEGAEIETKSSESEITVNTASLDKSMENFSKKLEEVGKNFGGPIRTTGGNVSKTQPNFTYLFNSLRKAINQQNTGLAKQIGILGGDKASTPLEMDVISTQVAGEINNQPSDNQTASNT